MLDLCYNTQNILHHSAIRIEATRSRRPFSPILLACPIFCTRRLLV
jgi:hypothetical protein